MEENVLFNPNQPQQAGGALVPTPQTTQQPSASQAPPPSTPPPPSQPQSPSSSPPPIKKRGGFVGMFIKLFVVLLVLLVMGIVVFQFVLPIFRGNSSSKDAALTYWGLWESDATMQTIIDDFQKENPTITVNYEKRDIDKYRQTLQTRIQNGDGPDVFLYHNSWTPVVTNLLSPISSEVMDPQEFENVYYPVVVEDLTVEGAIYGIPMGIDTVALFVNDSIFEETGANMPSTWEDFTNVSAGITVKDGENRIQTYGAGFGAYDNVNRAAELLSLLFLQNRVNLTSPQETEGSMVEAIRFYTDFVTGRDNIEAVWNTSAPNSLISFAGGNVGMYFGYSWDIFVIKELNPELKFSVHSVPKLQNDLTVASYWVNGISSNSRYPEAAQKFLSYLAKKETQEKLYTETSKVRLFGLPPARRDMADMVRDNPYVYPFVAQAETAKSTFFVSDTYDEGLNDQMDAYLGNAIRSVLGNTSVESATETLISGMEEVLAQYGVN